MRFTDIVYRQEDGVAWLTINRPEVYNAIRGQTSDEMVEVLQDIAADGSIRVAVISGAGPNAFSSGRDQGQQRLTAAYEGSSEVRYFDLIRSIPQPVIAMVDGYAIGSGNILAYTCDFTICSDRSRFGQTGPRVGSPASGYFVSYLQRVVGEKRAREIWMLCRQYTAHEALEMGLVNAVVPASELQAEVLRWCEEMKGVSPRILQLQKLSFNEAYDYMRGPAPTQRYDPDYQKSEEAEERRLAFLERRKPDAAKNLPYLQIPS
ncbi:MAG: enoyl-CoA hydratase-related protein [Candidatus Tectomicrobia bacterium]